MTFDQLNTAHAPAIDTGEIPSPATPEGDAISIPRHLISIWYDAAGELLQECYDWLKLKHGNHPSAAGLNFGETERRRELARLLFLDLAWLSGGSDLDAAPDRVAFLPPQPADLRGEKLQALLAASDDRLRTTEMRLIDATNAYRMTQVERDAAREEIATLKRTYNQLFDACSAEQARADKAEAAREAGPRMAAAALEALPTRQEAIGGQHFHYVQLGEAVAAVRAALTRPATLTAQPVAQEPVAEHGPTIAEMIEWHGPGEKPHRYSPDLMAGGDDCRQCGHGYDAHHAISAQVEVGPLDGAAEGLLRIVEGIDGAMNHGTWRDEKGVRLKDTPEWVAFYLASKRSAQSAPVGGEGGAA